MSNDLARGGLALVAAMLLACGPAESAAPPGARPPRRALRGDRCPDRMVPLAGLHACVDRYESVIRAGRAVPAQGVVPTRKASFEEAQRACEAAGYRLCSEREWTRACTGAGSPRKFAYGDHYEPGRCNTSDGTAHGAAPLPGGERARCVTPEGVYDLSGNVWEWTTGTDGSGTLRELRGGGFGVGEDDDLVACIAEDRQYQPLDASFDGYGFRCCTGTPAGDHGPRSH